MIIIKTEKKIGKYLCDSSVDGKPLREVKSMSDLDELSPNDYELVKTNRIITIKDLDKAKQDDLNDIRK